MRRHIMKKSIASIICMCMIMTVLMPISYSAHIYSGKVYYIMNKNSKKIYYSIFKQLLSTETIRQY